MKSFRPNIVIFTGIFTIMLVGSFLMGQASSFAADIGFGVQDNLEEQYQQRINSKKLISGVFDNRIYYTNNYDSDDRVNEDRDAFLKSELRVNLKLGRGFTVHADARFEQVSEDVKDGTDQYFANEGSYFRDLSLNYDYKKFSVFAGKFTANFGTAWTDNNGIWINGLAKKYKKSEKLGFGMSQRFGDAKANGEYVFGVNIFTNDRKNLDNSIFSKRNSAVKNDGKPGDTRSLESYVVSTDIHYDFSNNEKLSYHFSYANLAVNERHNPAAIVDDEKSYALNINYHYPINENLIISSLIEYVNIRNLDGDKEGKADFLTASFTSKIYQDYFLTLAKAQEKESLANFNRTTQTIYEVSIGYEFGNFCEQLKGLSTSIGYKNSKDSDTTVPDIDQSFGILIRHTIEF